MGQIVDYQSRIAVIEHYIYRRRREFSNITQE